MATRTTGYVSVRVSNLPVFKSVYLQVSECKHAIIRLHCATSKSSLWNMGYAALAVPLNASASIIQVETVHQS